MNILIGLNKQQIEAVTNTEGYIRVVAGAGSGKTKALTYRYAYLAQEMGIDTGNILCATFTNKAANEMKKRIRNMIGDNDTGYICTFHSFCLQLLKEDIYKINYPKNFLVMDTEDMNEIFKIVYETSHIQSKDCTFEQARKYIGLQKTDEKYIDSYMLQLDMQELKAKYLQEKNILHKIFLGYLYEQRKCYGLDFNDLIHFALYILENFADICQKWQNKLQYIMVDEFQDVNESQYRLAEILSGIHKNLFVVGDPDQTIYSWRGAKVEYILNFDKIHPNAKTIILNMNYRSSPEILNAANSLIKKNKQRVDKDLFATKKNNVTSIYYHAKTSQEESNWIAGRVQELVNHGNKYSDIAILYRANWVSRSIEETFINKKIPYVLYNGVEFYKRKEIKDVLAYLRMVIYADDLSFRRIINEPKRKIGEKRMAFLQEYAENHNISLYQSLQINLENNLFVGTGAKEFIDLIEEQRNIYKEKNISDVATDLLNKSGYAKMLHLSGDNERLENLAELKQSMLDFETTSGEETDVESYLQSIALFMDNDKREHKDSIKMMTIHTAKGLEFPFVFLCNFNEGIFPNRHIKNISEMEEERRLAYVAYTRAENILFLSEAEGYLYSGFRYPSRFLFDTDKQYINYTVDLSEDLICESNQYISKNISMLENKDSVTKKAIQVGDVVCHDMLGIGKVLEIKQETHVASVKFDNIETERNVKLFVLSRVEEQDNQ